VRYQDDAAAPGAIHITLNDGPVRGLKWNVLRWMQSIAVLRSWLFLG